MISKTVLVAQDDDPVILEIWIANNSDVAAPNVEVNISYDSDVLEYISHNAGVGTYNSTTKKWKINSLAPFSGRTMALVLKVKDVDALPVDVTWTADTPASDVNPSNDDCGKWTIIKQPSSTLAACTVWPIHGYLQCGKILDCGCCTRSFAKVADTEKNVAITLNTVTGEYNGYFLSQGQGGSFQWTAECSCDDSDDDTEYGPFTTTIKQFEPPVLSTSTADATPTHLTLLATETNKVYELDVTVMAGLNGNSALYRRLVRAENDAGSLTILGTDTLGSDHEDGPLSAASIQIVASGTNIRLTVTGMALTNILWRAAFNSRVFDLV